MKLATSDRMRVKEICDELSTIRSDDPPVLSWLTRELHDLLGARATTSYGLSFDSRGVAFDYCYLAGELPRDSPDRMTALWNSARHSWFYNPSRPDAAQRNTVVQLSSLLRQPSRDSVLQAMENHKSAGIDIAGQVRVLICDGPSLLAYVGAYHENESRSAGLLSALAQPLQKRLRLERQLAEAPMLATALVAALEAIGGAAFVLGPRGVTHMNAAGQALLAHDRRVGTCLREIASGRRGELAFEVTRLAIAGAPLHMLALLRDAPEDPRPRAARLGKRWKLTPRQEEVLALLAQGLANKTLAATLACAEDTIERHLSALFAKAGVDSRAALVAKFWTAG